MKNHTNCRVCGHSLEKYIDLGELPLSNNLCETQIERADKYPLQVMLCHNCGLSQLSVVIDPEILFGHYVYRSSINKGYVNHCRQMAKDLQKTYGLTQESFMVDIAGNDGALLQEFREEIGLKVLNVDPAENLGAICRAMGISTLSYFWSKQTASRILNSFGKADLVTATNVFAHISDVYDFMEAVKLLLKETGVLVLEMPYLIDFIEKNEFDTIYHEHLSYFSIYPLRLLCQRVDLEILNVTKHDIHGGSIRVIIGYGEPDNTVTEFINKETKYRTIEPYHKFSENVRLTIKSFADNIYKLKSQGNKIAGFAASAKGNTLLNCAGLTVGVINYIVDETPEKIGKYSPGTHIPIVSLMDMQRSPPDYLIILSWNFFSEIRVKCSNLGYKGKFIIGIPKFEIID